jgi:hypothetical protein
MDHVEWRIYAFAAAYVAAAPKQADVEPTSRGLVLLPRSVSCIMYPAFGCWIGSLVIMDVSARAR